MMSTDAELASRAARVASSRTLRFASLRGLLLVLPLLLIGAVLARLPRPHLEGLVRPLEYVAQPLLHAWRHDLDLSLLGYVLLQATLVAMFVAAWTTDLGRRAAVGLTDPSESPSSIPSACPFVGRRWGATFRARLVSALAFLLPLALALMLLGAGSGATSIVPRVLALAAALALVLPALGVVGLRALAGYLPPSIIAVEDTGARAGLGGALMFALASPRAAIGKRVAFGVRALGAILLRGLLLAVLGLGLYVGLKGIVGADAMTRALAILEAGGIPSDAARVGVGTMDGVLAALLALGIALLAFAWLADSAARVVTARIAAYLALRRDVEHVATDQLGPRVPGATHQDATAAGFVEVGRLS